MKQIAKLHYLRMAPRKVRLMADMIKGLPVSDAEAQLMYERKRAAKPLLKLLRSAVANAKNNKKVNGDALVVENINVDKGPMLKRFLPRARGMASPIHKVMSHVTLTLVEKENVKPKYKIVVAKKVKAAPTEKAKARKAEKEGDESSAKKTQNPAFFKKMFRRKAV